MANERAARQLGIGHEGISLSRNTGGGWLNPHNSKWESVESAALGWFMDRGWSGCAGEGGLILNLIKAMSFKELPMRLRDTYIEALYAQNVAFDEDRYDPQTLLRNVRFATSQQVARNVNRMTGHNSYRFHSRSSLTYFPNVNRLHILGLYHALGNQAILQIAEIFIHDSYKYRKGWPDLTLWRNKQVVFKEIKSPKDSLRPSQRTIIKEILLPLGLNVSVVDVDVLS